MKMTQADYAERAGRVADGTATDDDRRLVEHYEREGYTLTDGQDEISGDLEVTTEAEVVPARKTTRGRAKNGDTTK